MFSGLRWWLRLRQLRPSRRVLVAIWTFGFNRHPAAGIAARAMMRLPEVEKVLASLERQQFITSDWGPGRQQRVFWLTPKGEILAAESVSPEGRMRPLR